MLDFGRKFALSVDGRSGPVGEGFPIDVAVESGGEAFGGNTLQGLHNRADFMAQKWGIVALAGCQPPFFKPGIGTRRSQLPLRMAFPPIRLGTMEAGITSRIKGDRAKPAFLLSKRKYTSVYPLAESLPEE